MVTSEIEETLIILVFYFNYFSLKLASINLPLSYGINKTSFHIKPCDITFKSFAQ